MSRRTLVVLLAASLLAISRAEALAADPPGTYVVSACRAGDRPAPLVGWLRHVPEDPTTTIDECAYGGSFGFHFAGTTPQSGGGWRWKAPDDVVIAGLRLWRRAMLSSRNYAFDAGGPDFPLTRIDDNIIVGEGKVFRELTNLRATVLALSATCPWEGSCGPAGQFVRIDRIETVLRDPAPPRFEGEPVGNLRQSSLIDGIVAIRTRFSDKGGGVRSAAIIVDGVQRGYSSFGGPPCEVPYTVPVPCPQSGEVEVTLDTSSLSTGPHLVEVALTDVAGNASSFGPFVAVVRDWTAGSDPTSSTTAVVSGALKLSKRTVHGRYDKATALTGAVANSFGAPVPRALIEVATRTAVRHSNFESTVPVISDASGRFAVRLPPGTSRFVRLRYGGSEVVARVAVPAPIRFAAKPARTRNRRMVRFAGRILGTAEPTRVELQAQAGRRWIPFRTVALRSGKFSARYRFRSTTRTSRYRFRALVHAGSDFPYASGRSNVVSVLVRP